MVLTDSSLMCIRRARSAFDLSSAFGRLFVWPPCSTFLARGGGEGVRKGPAPVNGVAVDRFLKVVGPAGGVLADFGDGDDVQAAVQRAIAGAESRWRTASPEDTSIGAVPV